MKPNRALDAIETASRDEIVALQTERQVLPIRDFQPKIIMVTPSYMLAIADEFDRQGLNPADCALKIGIHGAEPWTQQTREEIEKRFASDAIDIYGLSELIGPGVAVECIESRDGPTIWEDHFYPEVIDPETGKVLPDGAPGELVFTSLTKEALPVVRYRTRDLTRLLPPTARSFRRIGKITGRTDDMLIIRGVNLFPSQIEELILKTAKLAPHYQLMISRQNHLDDLTVRVEMKPELAGDSGLHEIAAGELRHRIKALLGINTRIEVMDTGGVERSAGKAKRVVDLRQA